MVRYGRQPQKLPERISFWKCSFCKKFVKMFITTLTKDPAIKLLRTSVTCKWVSCLKYCLENLSDPFLYSIKIKMILIISKGLKIIFILSLLRMNSNLNGTNITKVGVLLL